MGIKTVYRLYIFVNTFYDYEIKGAERVGVGVGMKLKT